MNTTKDDTLNKCYMALKTIQKPVYYCQAMPNHFLGITRR